MRVRTLAIAATLMAGPSAAADQKPSVITNPDWLETPTSEAFAEFYPKIANLLELEGFAQIICGVSAAGRLTDCSVAAEAPRQLGFGAAAVQMASRFRMKPMTVDGKAIPGGEVRIPIRFKLPDVPPAPDQPPLSPDVRASARRLLMARDVLRHFHGQLEKVLAAAEASGGSDGVPDEARKAAIAAVRQASASRDEVVVDALSKVIANALSADELRALTAYADSSASLVFADPATATAMSAEVSKRLEPTMMAEIHDVFCSLRACQPSTAEARDLAGSTHGVLEVAEWAKKPSAEQLKTLRPGLAALVNVAGAARLTCAVQADSALADCTIAAEAPAGWGFGTAARAIASSYSVNPAILAGLPPSQTVALRVTFAATEERPREAARTAKSPGAVMAAKRLVDASGMDTSAQAPNSPAAGLPKVAPPEIDPEIYSALLEALETAYQRTIVRARDDLAIAIAAEYSEEQLVGAVAYFTSPVAQAAQAKSAQIDSATKVAMTRIMSDVASEARATFCASHDCNVPPPAGGAAAKP